MTGHDRKTLAITVLLCAPVILGTTWLTWTPLEQRRVAEPPPPGWIDGPSGWLGALGGILVFGSFYGATYGPLLIPLATIALVRARDRGLADTRAGWAVIAVALIAVAVFFGWTTRVVELP